MYGYLLHFSIQSYFLDCATVVFSERYVISYSRCCPHFMRPESPLSFPTQRHACLCPKSNLVLATPSYFFKLQCRLQHPQPEDASCHCGASTMKICPYKHHDDIWAVGNTAPTILNPCKSWRCSAVRPGRLNLRKWATNTHYTEGFLGPRAGLDTLEERKISYSCRESSHNYSVYQPVA
jgi:hypothetical protein